MGWKGKYRNYVLLLGISPGEVEEEMEMESSDGIR